jgi:hypothetical protein
LTIISKGVGLCPTFVAEKIDLRGEIAWMAGTIWMLAKCVADYELRGLNERAPVVLEM